MSETWSDFINVVIQWLHVSSLTGSERGLESAAMSRDSELLKPMKKRKRRDYLSPSEEDSEPEPMVRPEQRYPGSYGVITGPDHLNIHIALNVCYIQYI